MNAALVTATSSIFGDLRASIDAQRELGIGVLDIKDAVFGKEVLDLDDEEIERAAGIIEHACTPLYCLSTVLFHPDVAEGEDAFAAQVARVDRAITIARRLRPRYVRLLAATSADRAPDEDLASHLAASAPWLVGLYRDAIAKIDAAGFTTVIENEVGASILRDPSDVLAFLPHLTDAGDVGLIWDVQNMWRTSGELPSLDAYRALRPHLRYVHVKGGRLDAAGAMTRSTLDETDWPVDNILRAVLTEGASEAICVNPCKGPQPPGGYDALEGARSDVRTVQRIVAEVASRADRTNHDHEQERDDHHE